MSGDDLRNAINRLDDEFHGNYDALLEAYTKLKYRHQDLKVAIVLCILAGIIISLI